MPKAGKQQLSSGQSKELLSILKNRFEKNTNRHNGINWADVQAQLEASPAKLWSMEQREASGGEPAVVVYDKKTGEYVSVDCSAESPKSRRSFCYDRTALNARKEHKPQISALDAAEEMGIELLSAEQYRHLQELGEFDTKTSSWILT